VTDRYLFFPSVAAVILISWGVIVAAERLGRRGLVGAVLLLAVVGFLWGRTTLAYLSEWRDPRSVWYAATGKSSDPDVYYNLGWQYLDRAARLGATPRGTPLSEAEAERLASSVWGGDPRLAGLLAEWAEGQRGGPVEKSFQDHLRTLAWDALDRALLTRGIRVMPDLYFHRGLILLDGGDLQGARKEFLAALDEASRSNFAEGREQVMVNSHNDLGILAWTAGDYREALRWLQLAEDEQTRFGGNWVPDITENRKRLEAIIASLPAR
jgi:tetratricopeptide (TPR) repeat protein